MQALLSANPLPSLRRSVKTPVVYQAEAAECGLACLCMILQAHGDKRTLAELRQEYGLSLKGATLGDIITIAKRLSLSARALKLDLDDLPKLQLPCVVHWDMKHFVVLTAVNKNSVTIHDPATGKRKMPLSRFSAHFTGIALELSPAPAFTPVTATPKLTIRSFFSGLSGLRRTLLLTFCITLLIQLFALLSPYYMQMVVDDALPAGSSDFLTALTIGFALFLLIECLTSALRQHILLHFTSRLQLLMSARVFSHLLQLPLKWFHSRHTGDIISRFSSLNALRDFLTASFITVIMDGLMALVTVAVMYVYAPILATVVIVITFLYALFRVFAWHCVRPHHADKLELASKEQTHFIESMRAIQTIKQFNLEASRHGHWLNRLTSSLNADISIGKWGLRTSIAKQVITGAENIVVIYLGAQMAMENALTTGMLYAFISYKNRFVTAAESLITTALEWRMLSLHIDRLSDVVLAECEDVPVAFSGADGTDNAGPATLSLRQVSYAYDSFSAPVLENIDLTVAPGEAIAITGASGCGKSTLLKCITGIHPLSSGSVYFGTKPVSQGALKGVSSAVYQDDALLNGSILENIAGYCDSPDIQRAAGAAQLACIHDDIVAMPMQYQTLVGDMGSTLSGGQIQRIMLARALYQRPQILFLDEASSHLDMHNEAQVNHNLKQLNITRIIIAHRPQTIAMADRVFRLEAGKLTEIYPVSTNPVIEQQGESHD